MKIISWNVNGLRAIANKGNFNDLMALNADIICLQETKAHPEQLPYEVRNPNGYQSYFDHSKVKKGYSGVAIYTKKTPDDVIYGLGIPEFDDEGRAIGAVFGKTILLNVYFPNGGGGEHRLDYKMRYYDSFLEYINKKRSEGMSVIFCGDVNTAHTEIDLARPKENQNVTGFLPEERLWIDKIIKNGYIDIWRMQNPQSISYTWWDMKTRARDRDIGWRIDYFFVSEDLVKNVKNTAIMKDFFGSDHCPISIEVDL